MDAIAQQALQRAYYERTADDYDALHHSSPDEHMFALRFLHSAIAMFGATSVLDIGSGTGRALTDLKVAFPNLRVVGIEPSEALRERGYAKGLRRDELVDGDAQALPHDDGSFDFVCEFGALHHIPNPRAAVAEMLRVARIGIFISDSNNYGQGGLAGRMVKAAARATGLWRAFDWVRTGGRGYMMSDSDGLFYSYSVFDDYPAIRKACASVHVLNTRNATGLNPLFCSSHVAILGLKTATIASA